MIFHQSFLLFCFFFLHCSRISNQKRSTIFSLDQVINLVKKICISDPQIRRKNSFWPRLEHDVRDFSSFFVDTETYNRTKKSRIVRAFVFQLFGLLKFTTFVLFSFLGIAEVCAQMVEIHTRYK